MSIWDSMRAWSLETRDRLARERANPAGSSSGIAGWINSVVSGLNHVLKATLGSLAKVEVGAASLALWWDRTALHAYGALMAWLRNGWLKYFQRLMAKLYARLHAQIAAVKRQLIADDIYGLRLAMAYAAKLVTADRKAWRRAIYWVIRDYRTRIKWLHQNIEKEAVSGYALGRKARSDVIGQVGDLIINNAPAVRFVVKRLVNGILDVLVIDDPALRILLGFVMRHIIDRLGLDKPIGRLLGRLVSGILEHGKPKDLHGVIADISSRLAANEQQWADFMANGGSEILQAGDEWQDITSLSTNAALLALFATMALTPHAFARDLSATAGVVLNESIGAVAHLIERS